MPQATACVNSERAWGAMMGIPCAPCAWLPRAVAAQTAQTSTRAQSAPDARPDQVDLACMCKGMGPLLGWQAVVLLPSQAGTARGVARIHAHLLQEPCGQLGDQPTVAGHSLLQHQVSNIAAGFLCHSGPRRAPFDTILLFCSCQEAPDCSAAGSHAKDHRPAE